MYQAGGNQFKKRISMTKAIRIGTRGSELAVWQAKLVQKKLKSLGIYSELIEIKSAGEQNQKTPLYEMGVQGIFTKALDVALLNNEIDLAVHSLKDVPTQVAQGLAIAAVLERDNPYDVLVYKQKEPQVEYEYTIATSSLRRSAQWLHRYPNHKTDVLRGNINSRLQKLQATLVGQVLCLQQQD